MKTVTEFAGVSLRSLLALRQKLWNEHKAALKDAKKEEAPAPATPTVEAAPAEPVTPAESAPAADAPPVDAAAEAAPVDAAPAPEAEVAAPEKPRSLHDQVEDRVREELSKHLAETLKLEGEKLDWMLQALSLVDSRRATDLRRVVVYKLLEGEKAPGNVIQKGEAYFMAEYLAPVGGVTRPSRDRGGDRKRDGKGGRGKGRGGERGARGDRGDRGGRGPRVNERGPRADGVQVKAGGSETGGQRPPRAPRAPRPPREPRPPLPTGVAPITVQTSGIPAKKLSMPVPKAAGDQKQDASVPEPGPTSSV